MLKPEILREKAKLYVESCNTLVHETPWTTGHTITPTAGGYVVRAAIAALRRRVRPATALAGRGASVLRQNTRMEQKL
jgi:hypothetical protein